jgi:transcriptional regulator with PAS, ATPase and Fis domain
MKYLPSSSSSLPMLFDKSTINNEGMTERDLLYKVLFDLKRDVNDLKKLVYSNISGDVSSAKLIKDHQELFDSIEEKPARQKEQSPVLLNLDSNEAKSYELEKVEDIMHETEEDEELSLDKKEKEMIIKALRKNNNKRKYAAHDLGISERTLYRKIKQYEIEE